MKYKQVVLIGSSDDNISFLDKLLDKFSKYPDNL
jgi:hypothetical protein